MRWTALAERGNYNVVYGLRITDDLGLFFFFFFFCCGSLSWSFGGCHLRTQLLLEFEKSSPRVLFDPKHCDELIAQ